jgi:hypothetical protein
MCTSIVMHHMRCWQLRRWHAQAAVDNAGQLQMACSGHGSGAASMGAKAMRTAAGVMTVLWPALASASAGMG